MSSVQLALLCIFCTSVLAQLFQRPLSIDFNSFIRPPPTTPTTTPTTTTTPKTIPTTTTTPKTIPTTTPTTIPTTTPKITSTSSTTSLNITPHTTIPIVERPNVLTLLQKNSTNINLKQTIYETATVLNDTVGVATLQDIGSVNWNQIMTITFSLLVLAILALVALIKKKSRPRREINNFLNATIGPRQSYEDAVLPHCMEMREGMETRKLLEAEMCSEMLKRQHESHKCKDK